MAESNAGAGDHAEIFVDRVKQDTESWAGELPSCSVCGTRMIQAFRKPSRQKPCVRCPDKACKGHKPALSPQEW
jgi:hypothetical protein